MNNICINVLLSKYFFCLPELLYSFIKKCPDPFNCDVEDRTMFLRNEEMYLGFNVMTLIQKPEINSNKQMLTEFYEKCRQFLIVSCKQIKKRYLNNTLIVIYKT